MKPGTFHTLRSLAARHTGQQLEVGKSNLLESRLRGIAYRSGYNSIDELALYLQAHAAISNLDAEVATTLLDDSSRFVPERGEFAALLEEFIKPALEGSTKAFRIWCAGCGAGHEAYSLLMLIRNKLGDQLASRVRITATDISEKAIERAREGIFGHFQVQIGLSTPDLLKYFTRVPPRDWRISPVLKDAISFQSHNLLDTSDDIGTFNLIICRNVLSEMTSQHQAIARQSLHSRATEGGMVYLSGR